MAVKLPFIGKPSVEYGKRIVAAVSRCYTSVKLTPIFTSRTVPIRPVKDVVPTLALSNVIYFYECHCGSGYVGKTTQILLKRIEGHVPPIFRSTSGRKCKIPARHSSAIGQHLVENPECARKYDDAKFSILARGRSDYHLAVMEAIFILARRPVLCRQKKFILALKLFHSCWLYVDFWWLFFDCVIGLNVFSLSVFIFLLSFFFLCLFWSIATDEWPAKSF